MPNLNAFDQEFGRDPGAHRERRKRILRLSTIVAFLLGAGIVGALALAWPEAVALLRAELPPGLISSHAPDGSEEQVERLLTEVDALKQEVRELTQVQQQAVETIAALKAAEHDAQTRAAAAAWYSNPAALNFGIASRSGPANITPPAQQSATARPKAAPLPKREPVLPPPPAPQ